MSVQCSLGSETWAGPGFSSDTTTRKAVTDTTTAPFTAQSFAGVSAMAEQAKTVFLVRTGNYVGTTKSSKLISRGKGYYYGELPTSSGGQNYGPVSCPSSSLALDSAEATAITAENLRMCGSSPPWSWVNAYNFLEDKLLTTSYSENAQTGVGSGMKEMSGGGITKFLDGGKQFIGGKHMDDSRKIYIQGMSSDAFTPQPGNKAAFKDEIGGTWRSFGVAFYCDDYARTDLTTCKEENRKAFYTCDPNPDACYGTATQISSNKQALAQKCTDNADCCSGKCIMSMGGKMCQKGCEAAGDYLGPPPTKAPTKPPTRAPTMPPTNAPTKVPTDAPTDAPTLATTYAATYATTYAKEFSHAARNTASAMASLVCALVFAALSM
jgi:hypothetical protein